MCTTTHELDPADERKLSDCGRCVWLCPNGLADTQCNWVVKQVNDDRFRWCTVGDHGD